MLLLQKFLFIVRKKLESKGKTSVEIYIILSKLRKKYSKRDFFASSGQNKVEVKEEINTRESRVLALQAYYQDHGEKTGEWVFEPTCNSINDRHEYGRTLLHTAILDKNEVEIKQLVQKGVNSNIKDNGGLTPFQVAIIEEDKEIISLLENLGIK